MDLDYLELLAEQLRRERATAGTVQRILLALLRHLIDAA